MIADDFLATVVSSPYDHCTAQSHPNIAYIK